MTAPSDSGLDVSAITQGLRRRVWWIVLTALAFAAVAYALANAQPPTYQASASVSAANSQGQDGVIGSSVLRAPPLPQGTVQQAMQSTEVITPLIATLRRDPAIPAGERERLATNLGQELRAQQLRTITLTSRLDNGGNGIYTLRASARTARAAQALANQASAALLQWDRNRALQSVRRAQDNFRAQLTQLDRQIAQSASSAGSIERQTLITRRATLQDSLVQVNILESSAAGVLSVLSSAVEPLRPVAPRPRQNAILAGLLGLLLATGTVMLLTAADRTVRSEDDLSALNVSTLAVIPRIPRRDILTKGIVRAARDVGLYEAIGFLRVHLMTVFHNTPHPIIMVSSTVPSEGKSSLTATLADGFASSGKRVLIIDADLRRGTQDAVWRKYEATHEWHQLCGQGGVRTTREALEQPANVQVMRGEDNVDVLPAGPGLQNSLSLLNRADLGTILRAWSSQYDVVLLDSAPLLAVADGLVLGAHTDGVLMVAEYGRTPLNNVRAALRRAERGGLNLLGFVVNKAAVTQRDSYAYSYDYKPVKGDA